MRAASVLVGGWLLCLQLMTSAGYPSVPTQMDLRLMRQVTKDLGENQAISPLLMSSLLTQLWLGTGGTTRSQLSRAVGITEEYQDKALNSYKSATERLSQGSDNVTVAVFNRMYVKSDFSVKPSYQSALERYFLAGAESFSSAEQGAAAINSAVAAATRNKIPDLVSARALRDVPLVLVSALYFKGKWVEKFETQSASPFLTASGDKPVTMMGLTGDFLYGEFPQFDIVSLPYQDPDYSLLVLRPSDRSLEAVESLRSALDTLDTVEIYRNLTLREVSVTMPRFKIEKSYDDLSGDLKALGMTDMFDRGRADLSGISDKPLYVSSVILKVFMEVNEEGTEAAAAGGILIVPTSLRPDPISFVCDRPFFVVLYNNREEVNLFAAFVTEPTP